MLTIKVSEKPCDICMTKKAVHATFADGFNGSVCWKCVQKMFDARTNGKEKARVESKSSRPTTGA
jgi:hypothetical protein